MRNVVIMQLLALTVLSLPVSARAQQENPPDPKFERWLKRCGGVNDLDLDAAFNAALAHVRATGRNEAKFRKQIKDCPKRDLDYFRRVMAL